MKRSSSRSACFRVRVPSAPIGPITRQSLRVVVLIGGNHHMQRACRATDISAAAETHPHWNEQGALATSIPAFVHFQGFLALRYTGHAGGNGGLAPDYMTL